MTRKDLDPTNHLDVKHFFTSLLNAGSKKNQLLSENIEKANEILVKPAKSSFSGKCYFIFIDPRPTFFLKIEDLPFKAIVGSSMLVEHYFLKYFKPLNIVPSVIYFSRESSFVNKPAVILTKYVPGKTLHHVINEKLLYEILDFLHDKLWTETTLPSPNSSFKYFQLFHLSSLASGIQKLTKNETGLSRVLSLSKKIIDKIKMKHVSIIHGDFSLRNMLIPIEQERWLSKIVLVDWEDAFYGNWLQDIANLIVEHPRISPFLFRYIEEKFPEDLINLDGWVIIYLLRNIFWTMLYLLIKPLDEQSVLASVEYIDERINFLVERLGDFTLYPLPSSKLDLIKKELINLLNSLKKEIRFNR